MPRDRRKLIKDAHTSKRYTKDQLTSIFNNRSCKLISYDKYRNINSKLDFVCKCGHVGIISIKELKAGKRCEWCNKKANPDQIEYKLNTNYDKLWNPMKAFDIKAKNATPKLECCIDNILYSKTKHNRFIFMFNYTRNDIFNSIKKYDESNLDLFFNDLTSVIRHKFPVRAFYRVGIENQLIINALDNLKVYNPNDKIYKEKLYDEEEFYKYLENKKINYLKK